MSTTAALSTVVGGSRDLDLEGFARAVGLHPELVLRLVCLGLLEPEHAADSELRFPAAQVARAARIQRLRSGLSLTYASIGLVLDLLERIDTLEAALRRPPHRGVESRWT